MADRHQLRWTSYTPPPPELPTNVERRVLLTASGNLELLLAAPQSSTRPPLLFLHGTNCSAMCFLHWLPFFAEHGFPTYAVSLRGRGQSWKPSMLSMMFTTKHAFAEEAVAAIKHVESTHHESPILLAHSSGASIAQYLLTQGMAKLRGLCLLAGMPGVGTKEVMGNWTKFDPNMNSRMFRDLFHPRSMLSTTTLVHNAFFSPDCPRNEVQEFEKTMPEYESVATALGFLGKYAEPAPILTNISGEGLPSKILLIGGSRDKLMPPKMVVEHAGWLKTAPGAEKLVSYTLVEGSAHHLMRDVCRQECAQQVLAWLDGRSL